MAGRGKLSTMPAWMTQGSASVDDLLIVPDPQFSNPDLRDRGSRPAEAPVHGHQDRNDRDVRDIVRDIRGGERDVRSRDRDRDRDRGRERDNRDHRDNRDNRDHRDSRDNNRDNNRDRRYRDDRRGDDRGRRSPSPHEEWKPKLYRQSNFDVMGPGGIELPGVGVSIMLGVSYNTGVVASSSMGSNGGGGGGGGMGGMSGSGRPASSADGQSGQHTRHARRLYVGGLPVGTSEDDVTSFFVIAIQRATAPHGIPGLVGSPVIQTYINADKCFGFVEFFSIELTASCLDLSGIRYGASILRIRRPNDYKPELVPPTIQPLAFFNTSVLDIVSIGGGGQSQRADSEHSAGRMFIGGLPYYLTDDQVRELLGAFGPLKNFNLVRDPGSITSKGYAFCEYADFTCTTTAIAGLHGLPLGDKTLTVRLASQQATGGGGGGAPYGFVGQVSEYMPPPVVAPSAGGW